MWSSSCAAATLTLTLPDERLHWAIHQVCLLSTCDPDHRMTDDEQTAWVIQHLAGTLLPMVSQWNLHQLSDIPATVEVHYDQP